MSNWDAFKFKLQYRSEEIHEDLIEIEAHRLSVNKLILPQAWIADLRRLHIVRFVHGTTAIEGNPLTEEQVARQLSDDTADRPPDQIYRQTENAQRVLSWIEKTFADAPRLSLRQILVMHRILTEGSDEHDNHPGRLRASGHEVTVGSPQFGGVHRSPPGGQVLKRLVDDFFDFIHSRAFNAENPVIQALAAHFYFVTLHPFGDGNGRTTRCIEAAVLFGGGYNTHGFYSLSNFFYRNRADYFRLLQETRTKHHYDLTEFLRFGLRGFREELEKINTYIRNQTNRLQYRELIRRCENERISERRRLLNGREAKLLHAILDVSQPPDPFSDEPAREASLEDLSTTLDALYGDKTDRTIHREITRLQELGFIRFSRDKSSDTLRVLTDFHAIARY